jgi:hypothetical protein
MMEKYIGKVIKLKCNNGTHFMYVPISYNGKNTKVHMWYSFTQTHKLNRIKRKRSNISKLHVTPHIQILK